MQEARTTFWLTAMLGLWFAGNACAATFVVDSLSTEADSLPGDGVCRTASGVCTLVAAFQEAEAGIESTFDVIDLTGVSGTIVVNSVIFGEPVELRGSGITLEGDDKSFLWRGENSTISGIEFVGFRAIALEANGQTFAGNTVRGGNGLTSIGTNTAITGNRVFGQQVGVFAAIDIEGNDNGIVEDNIIGFDELGAPVPGEASAGIAIERSQGINVTANSSHGYLVGFFLNEVTDSRFSRNRIGDFDGAVGNGASDFHGIWSAAGVNNVFDSNLTNGNAGHGIFFDRATNATVTGHTAKDNGNAGIQIESSATVTVSTSSLEGNATGITALGPGSRFRENRITENVGIGIDLGEDGGITPNDDADGFTNFPVLGAAVRGSTLVVDGTLSEAAAPDSDIAIDFLASDRCDASGNGEGATPIGSVTVTTNAGGHAVFSESISTAVAAGQVVTATATGPDGTSEFSACITVVAGGDTVFEDGFEP